MLTADFDYALPDELIAQQPAPRRDASRLLVLRRQERQISHQTFPDLLQHLRAGDVLVLNNSKVIPARLHAVNPETGGILEILLLEENSRNDWWAMMRPGKRAPVGREFILMDRSGTRSAITVTVRDTNDAGHRRLEFSGTPDIGERLDEFGELPLPPYIKRAAHQLPPEDDQRYQTVMRAIKDQSPRPPPACTSRKNCSRRFAPAASRSVTSRFMWVSELLLP